MAEGHVYFIGAGPGAPDLLTLRGRAVLEKADLVVYADSLVDPRLSEFAPPGAEVLGSSALTLEEVVTRMVDAARSGKVVARLQSGDPAIYGAIHEQIVLLDKAAVPWTIVPGVSSAFAAAATLGVELTIPEVSQTVIMTRVSGRASAVPERESLRSLAAHGTSLVLFLSVSHIHRVVDELLAGGYPKETPAAVVYRASWPDEAVVRAQLGDVVSRVRALKWTKQALILVGPAIGEDDATRTRRSRLYSADYTHLFRTAERPKKSGTESASA